MNRALLPKLGDDVRLERYDIFDAWPHEKADLVIAANILNRDYFEDSRLTDALRNLRGALKDGGRLALIENRPAEQSNLFRLEHGRFIVEDQVGAGSDVQSLVTELV
jgi:chemotaxis methyl-accepting protein methylase